MWDPCGPFGIATSAAVLALQADADRLLAVRDCADRGGEHRLGFEQALGARP